MGLLQALPHYDGPGTLKEAVEAAHAKLHYTRCQGWMRATGNRPTSPYTVLSGKGRVEVVPIAKPMPRDACEFHPVGAT